MPFHDVTNDFHTAVRDKENAIPQQKRRKTKRTRDDPTPVKEFSAEAYIILNHIVMLARMLTSIRNAYLNVDSRISPLSRQGSKNIDLTEGESSWSNIRHLTNEERDQIDLQAKVILTRCSDRIKEMETLEKHRAELVANKGNPLTRLLPTRLRQDESTVMSDFIAAHHSSITWYLSRRLTETSQTQKLMQEERVKRQLERTKTLGSGATREAQAMSSMNYRSSSSQIVNSEGGRWLGGASSNLLAATLGVPTAPSSSQPILRRSQDSTEVSDDDDEELELSASQILQFETENANILQSVQDTLESVQQAESRLMDISALQMELVTHLTKQTELTDQLFEDAIATTSTVEKGNEQLREAKRRAKDSRLFILVFLIGASLSLLFLHYY